MSTKGRHLPDGPPCSAVLNLINSWKWRRRPSTPQNPATPLCVLRSHPPPLSTSQNDVKFNRARPSVRPSHAPQNPSALASASPRWMHPTQTQSRNSFVRIRNRELMPMLKEGDRGGQIQRSAIRRAQGCVISPTGPLWPRGRVHATYGPPYSGALINLNKTSD